MAHLKLTWTPAESDQFNSDYNILIDSKFIQSGLSVTVTFLANMKVAEKHYLIIIMLLMVQQVGFEISDERWPLLPPAGCPQNWNWSSNLSGVRLPTLGTSWASNKATNISICLDLCYASSDIKLSAEFWRQCFYVSLLLMQNKTLLLLIRKSINQKNYVVCRLSLSQSHTHTRTHATPC